MMENSEHLTPVQKQLYDWLVQYIDTNKHSPSIREMMKAMNLRSPAPIQSRLERMRSKGYLEWTEGQARTLKILKNKNQGLSITGKVITGGIIEGLSNEPEKIDFNPIFNQYNCFALQVTGNTMISEHIAEGDYLIMRMVSDFQQVKDKEIVMTNIEGYGTTLRRVYLTDNEITLKSFNPDDEPIISLIDQVEIQGVLTSVCRLF